MRWKQLAEPDLVGSPELTQEQARWLKNHSPHLRVSCEAVGGLGPRKACRASVANPLIGAVKNGALVDAHPGLRVASNRSARELWLNEEGCTLRAHCCPQKNGMRVGRDGGGHPVHEYKVNREVVQWRWREERRVCGF